MGSITFDSTLGLGSDLTLDRNLTIAGNLDAAGNPLVTVSRGGAPYAVDLAVNGGVTASVFGLGFTGGESHAVSNAGTLTLDHVAITGNWVGGNEPGPVGNHYGTVYNSGTLVVRDSRITNNVVFSWQAGGGGGIYSTGTLTVFVNCRYSSSCSLTTPYPKSKSHKSASRWRQSELPSGASTMKRSREGSGLRATS
jgi:hypothetical protein